MEMISRLLLVIAFALTSLGVAEADTEPGPFSQHFMIVQFRADEELEAFEIWHLMGDLSGNAPFCQLRATTAFKEWTGNGWQLLPWIHESTQITKLGSGAYRITMTGRTPAFKSLEIVLRFDPQGKIVDVGGMDPADPIFRFVLERKRRSRTVTIENPASDLPNVSW